MSGQIAPVYATDAALKQAARLLPGACLENLVRQAILEGRKKQRFDQLPELPRHCRYVHVPQGDVVCTVSAVVLRPTGRRAWRVVAVERNTR